MFKFEIENGDQSRFEHGIDCNMRQERVESAGMVEEISGMT
jgi:hypothetical protein